VTVPPPDALHPAVDGQASGWPALRWIAGVALAVLAVVYALHTETLRMLERNGDAHGVVGRTLVAPSLLANAPIDVWFTGSSQIREAADPLALAPVLGAVANAGASGKNPCRALHEQRAVRAHAPSVVVLGLSYFDLDDTKCSVSHPRLLGASGGPLAPDLAGLLPPSEEHAIGEGARWPWLATRPWQRDALVARLRSPMRGTPPPNLAAPFRYDDASPEPVDVLRARWRAAPDVFATVDVDGVSAQAIRRSIAGWQASGSRVVVVAMPLHPSVTATERDPVAAARLDAVLAAIASEHGVTVLDWEDAFDAAEFYDITHLNAAGRRAFGERITAVLRAPASGG
jgi:hypothetical protein